VSVWQQSRAFPIVVRVNSSHALITAGIVDRFLRREHLQQVRRHVVRQVGRLFGGSELVPVGLFEVAPHLVAN
jgi:hypothetical protein